MRVSGFGFRVSGFGERAHWFRVDERSIGVKKDMQSQKYPDSCERALQHGCFWLKAVALSPPAPPPGKKKGRRNLCSCGKKAWMNKLAGELGAGNT